MERVRRLSVWALLEAGVPESDPALKNIIYYVREHALAQTRTYEVSLAILASIGSATPAIDPSFNCSAFDCWQVKS